MGSKPRLTVTKVVFEFKTSDGILRPAPRLTVTKVVFECQLFSFPVHKRK